MAVDKAVVVGIIAHRSLRRVVEALAVTRPLFTLTDLLAVAITMHRKLAAIPGQVEVFQVDQATTLGFGQTTALQQGVDQGFFSRNSDGSLGFQLAVNTECVKKNACFYLFLWYVVSSLV